MNYQRIYNELINKARTQRELSQFEVHHIVPKSMGGSDDMSNLVNLTLREHFVAHALLAKIHGKGMWFAFRMMSSSGRYNSKLYSKLKASFVYSDESKKRMSESAKLRVYTPEGNAKRSSAFKGRKHSEETIKKMSASQKGRTFSEDHKNKLKSSHKGMSGKSFTKESRQRMSEAQMKPPVTCPHCNKTGKGNCMKRWHFDNCKSKVFLMV